MTQSHRIIIELLSSALNEVADLSAFADVCWPEVVKESKRAEVVSIAFDGYQRIHDQLGDHAIPRIGKVKWVGQTIQQESLFARQQETSAKLASFFAGSGLTTYVLKGASIAQCYPIPAHRYSCDFDCFLVRRGDSTDTSISTQEIGNKIVENVGMAVDRSYYKDSGFTFEGLHVENHRFCCSIKRGKRTKELEAFLQGLLKDNEPTFIEGTQIALPPLMFQALFLMEHACGHFLYEKMSLKNICDWAMFRKHYLTEMDWNEYDTLCKRFGLKEFVDSMSHLADFILGDCDYASLSALDKRVLDDTLKDPKLPKKKMQQRIRKAFDTLKSSWKFRHFSSDSMVKELSHSFFAYLFEKEAELEFGKS